MSGPKIVLLVLVLIAILFALGVGAGVSHIGKSAKLDDWPVTTLGALLVKKQPLGAGEIKSDCLKDHTFTFPASGHCVATVSSSNARLRTFQLRLKAGSAPAVKVHWLPNDDKNRSSWEPKEGIEVKQSLKDFKPLELQPPAAGGVLSLDLVPPGTAVTTWVVLEE